MICFLLLRQLVAIMELWNNGMSMWNNGTVGMKRMKLSTRLERYKSDRSKTSNISIFN